MELSTLLKYFSCQTSDSENQQILSWLANDSDGSHKEEYRSARMIYNGMILNVSKELPKTQNLQNPSSKRYKKFLWIFGSIAASILLMMGVFHLAQDEFLQEYSNKFLYAEVPNGQTFELTLEDGTSMFMNSGTKVKYPLAFAKDNRIVEILQGEVLFNVTADSKRPFIVKTFAADLTVLGTSFNLQSYPQDNYFSTTLIQGKVSVDDSLTGKSLTLLPNMMVEYRGGKMQLKTDVDVKTVSNWTEGIINLDGLDFNSLMAKFERAFGITIQIERENLPEICYTRGKIRVSDGIEHALNVLKMAADFQYERNFQTNTIIIR